MAPTDHGGGVCRQRQAPFALNVAAGAMLLTVPGTNRTIFGTIAPSSVWDVGLLQANGPSWCEIDGYDQIFRAQALKATGMLGGRPTKSAGRSGANSVREFLHAWGKPSSSKNLVITVNLAQEIRNRLQGKSLKTRFMLQRDSVL